MGAMFWWNFWNAVIIVVIVGAIIGLTIWVRRSARRRRGAGSRASR